MSPDRGHRVVFLGKTQMGTGEFNASMDWHPIQGGGGWGGGGVGVKILLVTSRYRNWDKLGPDGPLGSYENFTLTW